MKVELLAPSEYVQLLNTDPDFLNSITGGCGPGGSGDILVPDKILGINIRPA